MPAQPRTDVTISGTGSYLPDRVVDNAALSELVRGYDAEHSGDFGAWVDQVTHVHERRFCDFPTRSSDLALPAARQALEAAGIEATDLGMIVYATFTPSHDLPGDHCLLAEALGARDAATFNLKAACAGSIYGLGLAWSLVASGVYEHVLVVASETISKALNFHDPITSIIFGDGAGAAVVSRQPPRDGEGMWPPHLGFKFSPRNIHLANSNAPVDVARFPDRETRPGVPLVEQALVEMESGPNVLRSAILAMADATVTCLGYEPKALKRKEPELVATLERARLVPHQANGRIIEGLGVRLGVPPERVVRTIYRYGNVSAASNLLALDHALRHGNMQRVLDDEGRVVRVEDRPEQRIDAGDLVLLPSIGGGYLLGCVAFVAGERLVAAARGGVNGDPAA